MMHSTMQNTMIAPIDGREFSRACRLREIRNKNPALCRGPQLLRLLALAVIAGGFASVALEPGRAALATLAIFGAPL
jgi:hypothetical protein